MSDFDSFDMNMDGVVDGIDFLGFDYLIRYVLEPDEPEDYHDSWESAYSGADYEVEEDHDVRESEEELEDECDSSYDYDIPEESFWPPLSELDEDHGNVYLSPQDKRELADYYEKRARRWGERVDTPYKLHGRHHNLRCGAEAARLDRLGGRGRQSRRAEVMPDPWWDWDGDEPARLADRFNEEVDNIIYDSDGLEREDYLEFLSEPYPIDEEPAHDFYEQWAAGYDDYVPGV